VVRRSVPLPYCRRTQDGQAWGNVSLPAIQA
jgi:hypothetical protein